MPILETLQVTLELTEIFERLGIDHLVGGSLASSLHGIPRATQDVDMLVRLSRRQIKPLIEALGDRYYADESALIDAVTNKGTINFIHLHSMIKIDVFIFTGEQLQIEEMSRAQTVVVSEAPYRALRVADAADIVIQKLLWYEKGGRISQRQWDDVLGVLRVCGADIDMEYLQRWVKEKGLSELFAKAVDEASL